MKPIQYPARGQTDAEAEAFFADYYGRDSVAYGIAMRDPKQLITLLQQLGVHDEKLEEALRLHVGKRIAGRTPTVVRRVRLNRHKWMERRAIALFRRAASMLRHQKSCERLEGYDRDDLAYRVLLKCNLVSKRTNENQHKVDAHIRRFLKKAQRRDGEYHNDGYMLKLAKLSDALRRNGRN